MEAPVWNELAAGSDVEAIWVGTPLVTECPAGLSPSGPNDDSPAHGSARPDCCGRLATWSPEKAKLSLSERMKPALMTGSGAVWPKEPTGVCVCRWVVVVVVVGVGEG